MPTTTKEKGKVKKITAKSKETTKIEESKDTIENKSSLFREGEKINVENGTLFAIEVLEGTYVRITVDLKSYTKEILDFHGKVRKQAHKKNDNQTIISIFRFIAKSSGEGEIILKTVNRPDHKLSLHFPVTVTT